MRRQRHDPSHSAWLANAVAVESNPETASASALRKAIAYLRYERGRLILMARRRGRKRPDDLVSKIDATVARYVALLNGTEVQA